MNLILIAVISLGAIALVLAAILYVASKKSPSFLLNVHKIPFREQNQD